MILTVSQMQQVEKEALVHGAQVEDLMEEAGSGIARVIEQFFPKAGTCVVYCGKGHNGGDALVAARFLALHHWKVLIRLAFPKKEMALLAQAHLQELIENHHATSLEGVPGQNDSPLILIDGLLGIGACGEPQGSLALLIQEMNEVRHTHGAFTVAADLPSGLDATTGESAVSCVQADLTVTIAFAKTGLLADRATNYVGRLALVPLSALTAQAGDSASLITSKIVRALLPPRSFDVHKGIFGHVGIVAGSRGYLGAARMASTAALHAGAGLVTLYALPDHYELLATSCSPEVMIKPIARWSDVLSESLDALAIGPGLGEKHHVDILEIVKEATIPCVVDADALNALAPKIELLLQCQGPRLLTPHPGEMERLFPAEGRDRSVWATAFVEKYPVILLLKGARTIIAEKKMPLAYNTTGNPGMASGGMGDVLTGVTAAFLAGGQTPRDAAMLGAWLCGRAAECAIYEGMASEESLVASDVIAHLGRAMKYKGSPN
ncbi:MAG: hypothetical protein A3F67_04050 [Verrucomicrobia bacterium RIFCSPHIGHO2_12_FULL_41_10]|nr:MAG: hypothetical protein A3F67_04050 [Verrucomicrobia bacterium RIFCSPHIGHO2_12_FULL_41_10]